MSLDFYNKVVHFTLTNMLPFHEKIIDAKEQYLKIQTYEK